MEIGKVEFEKVVVFQEGPGVRNWQFRDAGIKLINIKNIVDDKLCLSNTSNYLAEKEVKEKYRHFLLNKGDFVMASSGVTWGKIAEVNDEHLPLCLNTSIIRVVSRDEQVLIKWYLYYFIKSPRFRNQIERLITGSAQPNFGPSHLKKVFIKIPPVAEQQEVVNQIVCIESIIKKRKMELEELDNLIKSRFVEMFGNGEYPKLPIQSLVQKKVSAAKKDFEQTDLIKYIDISSVDNKRNVMTGYTEYVLSEAPSRAQQHIMKGDIVVSTVRPNLRNVAITEFDDDNLVASSGFCVLRAVKCLPAYLMAIVCSDDFTEAMGKVVTGANYPAIKNSDVLNYIVSVPPIELQEQFADFVNQVDKLKSKCDLAIKQKIYERGEGYVY